MFATVFIMLVVTFYENEENKIKIKKVPNYFQGNCRLPNLL